MKIERSTVEHVASLARLSLTEAEAERLRTQMGDMIDFADKLKELDTGGILPTTHAITLKNVFREDAKKPSFDRDTMLENAPRHDESCIVVPRVVE